MTEWLKKRLWRALTIFNRGVLGGFVLAALYFGNWIFVSDKFTIPTESMLPTLIPGDRIVVNKLIFGARIYKNLDFMDGAPLRSWRMPGWRKIKRGEVLVFNFPHGKDDGRIAFEINYVYAKRCVGVPGDTVNHRGELRVPARGDTIIVNNNLHKSYRQVIEYETGRALADTLITKYAFRDNYYWVVGDNFRNSYDSRGWGFVPEEFIIGVARHIVYSRDRQTDKFRWNRLWKRIDRK